MFYGRQYFLVQWVPLCLGGGTIIFIQTVFFNYFQPISNFITQVGIKETSWYHELPLTGSSVHETLNVYPDFTSTSEKAPANTFYIGPSGSVSPAVIDMGGQHLFGSLYASLRNPPAFHVNYLKPGKFKVRTSGVAFFVKS